MLVVIGGNPSFWLWKYVSVDHMSAKLWRKFKCFSGFIPRERP